MDPDKKKNRFRSSINQNLALYISGLWRSNWINRLYLHSYWYWTFFLCFSILVNIKSCFTLFIIPVSSLAVLGYDLVLCLRLLQIFIFYFILWGGSLVGLLQEPLGARIFWPVQISLHRPSFHPGEILPSLEVWEVILCRRHRRGTESCCWLLNINSPTCLKFVRPTRCVVLVLIIFNEHGTGTRSRSLP